MSPARSLDRKGRLQRLLLELADAHVDGQLPRPGERDLGVLGHVAPGAVGHELERQRADVTARQRQRRGDVDRLDRVAPVVEGVSGTGFIYGPPGADVASLSTGVIIEVYSGRTASAAAVRDLMVGDVELYESGSDQILVRPVGGADVDFEAFLARLGRPEGER